MKILFNANRLPYPPYRGDKLKIFNLAKRLSKKHELYLLTFIEDKEDLEYIGILKEYFKEIHVVGLPKLQSYWQAFLASFKTIPFQAAYFSSTTMEKKIAEITSRISFDAVHIQHLRMAQFWYNYPQIPRILDLPDAYSLYWERRMTTQKGAHKWFAQKEHKRVYAYEKSFHQFQKVLVCSQEDKKYLETEHLLTNVDLLANGVDLEIFFSHNHNYTPNNHILFTGNMDYGPNVDAVCYFAEEIFPLILKKFPESKFVIAGQRPVEKVLALSGANIEVTGFIRNLADVYKQASIVVAPLRYGAGTQNKVLEAMAMGVPVVSRNIGFNGLNINSGEGVILSLETNDFAEQCIRLLGDANLREEIGEKGRQVINQNFDWNVIARQLENYFEAIQPK